MYISQDKWERLTAALSKVEGRVADLEKPKDERFFTCKRKDCGQVFESWYHPRPKLSPQAQQQQQCPSPYSIWDGLSPHYIGGPSLPPPPLETAFCERCWPREQQDAALLVWAKDHLDLVNKLKEEEDECL